MGLSARLDGQRQRHRQIAGGFGDFQPAHQVHEHIVLLQRHAAVAIHHRQQHGDALRVETLRDAARRAEAHAIDQRLQLDQQRPAAVARHRHDAARRRLARTRQENRRRVAHLAQSLLAHVEERQLAHRAEAVLGGAHVAEAAGRITLEIQHRVDQVLEHARTGDGAVLGHVADDDHAHLSCSWRSAPAARCIP